MRTSTQARRTRENGSVPNITEGKTYRVVGRIAMDQMVVDLEPGLSDPALGYLGAPPSFWCR